MKLLPGVYNETSAVAAFARVLAPTTAGEFLRRFDIGDIHDLSRVHRRLPARVRPHQTATCCTLDVDSSVYAQASTPKQANWSLVICAGAVPIPRTSANGA